MPGLLSRLGRALNNPGRVRLEMLRLIGKLLVPKYRFKWDQMAWWDNDAFTHYLTRFGELGGYNTDRRWMLSQLLRLIKDVPGDTAECGVYMGAGSWLICDANRRNPSQQRTHHIFDSFEGVSEPGEQDTAHWQAGDLACGIEAVRKNLGEFQHISLHKGWIPERFTDVADKQFAFVHIDVDLHEPTRDSMRFFYPRMSPGGTILCDDYGFATCPGATSAVDEYLQDKQEKMISLPSGGGFLIKGCVTEGAPEVRAPRQGR